MTQTAGEYLEALAERWAAEAGARSGHERASVVAEGLGQVMAAAEALAVAGLDDPGATSRAVSRLEAVAGRQVAVLRSRNGVGGAWWRLRHDPTCPVREWLGEVVDRARGARRRIRGRDAPVLEGVAAGPFARAGAAVAVISIERWTDGPAVQCLRTAGAEDDEAGPPWASGLEDDVGTTYAAVAGGGGGGDAVMRSTSFFRPAIPHHARTLWVTGPGGRVEVDLCATTWGQT
jgi:hypothetical protein